MESINVKGVLFVFTKEELETYTRYVCGLQKAEDYQECGNIIIPEDDTNKIDEELAKNILDYLYNDVTILDETTSRNYVYTPESILKEIE